MGLFDFIEDVASFSFGWIKDLLIPKLESPESGIKSSYANPNKKFPVIYGQVGRIEGTIVFQKTVEGTNNDISNELLLIIVVWGEGQCESINNVRIEEDLSTSSRFTTNEGRWLHVRNFTNGMDDYIDSNLTNAGWRGSDKLMGKCCSLIQCEFTDEEGVWGGFPRITGDITGRIITTPNGFSPTASSNPVSQAYDYLKNPIYGKGTPDDFIDIDSFDDQVSIPLIQVEDVVDGGNFHNLFSSNIVLDTENTVLDNFNTLLSSMQAAAPIINGRVTLVIEKDDPPVYFSLSEDGEGDSCQIVELGDIRNNNKAQRYDRVKVKYTDPDQVWTSQEAIWPVVGSQLETDNFLIDGVSDSDSSLQNPNEGSVTLETCTNYYEALHRAKSLYELSREGLRTSATCEPEATELTPGDIINVSHSFPGWVDKPFRVESTEEDYDTGLVTLLLREHQPYIYDFENTGLKPNIPDSNLAYTKPAIPTNLEYIAVYNSYSQVSITWDGPTSNYELIVSNNSGVPLFSEVIARKEYSIDNLEIGSYKFEVRAIGGLRRRSDWAELDFTITQPATPNTNIGIDNGNGVITVTPPTPSQQDAIYEGFFTTNDALDPNSDSHSLFRIIPSGRSLVVPAPAHGITYYVWYRLKTKEGTGLWYVREVVSTGIVIDQLAPSLSAPIERVDIGGEIDQAIDRLDLFNLDTTNSLTRLDLFTGNTRAELTLDIQNLAVDAIGAINSQLFQNYITSEYVNEIEGFRAEIDEAVGSILVEGGAVTAQEFTATSVLVDTHNGQIATLIQNQSTTDDLTTLHTSQIEQNADDITLLTTSLGQTDFASLSLRLNSAENELVSTSVSVTNTNVNVIDQMLSGALTATDLIDTEASVAVTQESLATLTTDTDAIATKQTEVLAIAQEAQAGYLENIESLANETQARSAADTTLQVNIDDEANNRSAAIGVVNQAIVEETQARTTADTLLQARITDESNSREAEISTVQDAIADESSARASETAVLQTNIDNENTSRLAQASTIIQSVTDEQIARVSADTLLQSNIDSEASQRTAAINTVQQTVTDEASARAAADLILQTNIDSEASARGAAVGVLTQAVVDEEGARAAADTILQASIDSEARTRGASIGSLNTTIANETSARAQADILLQANIDSEVSTRTSQINTVNQAITDEASTRAALGTQLTALDNDVTSQATRLTAVENQADGTQVALDVLELTVGNVSDPTSIVRRLDKAETDTSNNSTAISAVEASVTNIEGDVVTAFSDLQAVSDDVTGIQATARFGVDVNGNFTGIIANGSTVANEIIFSGSKIKLYDPALNAYALEYSNNKWIYGGSLEATAGTFDNLTTIPSGFLRTGDPSTDGTRVVVNGPDASGDYAIFVGNGAQADENAYFFVKKDGTGFIKGEFFQGQISRERDAINSNGKTATATGHLSAGKTVRVSGNFLYASSFSSSGKKQPLSLAWRFKRGNAVIDSGSFPAQLFQELETGIWNGNYTSNLNITTFDSGASDGQTYNYTFEVTSVLPSGVSVASLRTTVSTYENLIG